MNKILKRITILAGIFLVAVGVYFITSLNRMNQSETVYTAMEAPTLPVVYTDLFGMEKNRLIGDGFRCGQRFFDCASRGQTVKTIFGRIWRQFI